MKATDRVADDVVIAVIVGAVGTWAIRIDVVVGIDAIVKDEMALPARSDIPPLFRSRVELTDMPLESYSPLSVLTV